MSTSRIFRAYMSLLAFTAIFAALGSSANAATTGPAGVNQTVGSDPSVVNDEPTGSTSSGRGPVVLKIRDYSVNFGGRFRLSGKTGRSQQGNVRVEARSDGRWHALKKVKTDKKGHFRIKVRARTSTTLRVKTNDGRKSKARKVMVIGHVKLADSERYVRLGRSLLIRGSVVPRGTRTVRVRIRGRGVVTTRTRANGRFRVRWTPGGAGDFSYRVRILPNASSTGDASLTRRFSALRPGHASYYGPGLYGNGVACGGTLLPTTRGVANKYLPCGTKVTLQYGNRTVVARVIDRGPYVAGRDWDLTEQTKKDLGFGGVGVVWTNK